MYGQFSDLVAKSGTGSLNLETPVQSPARKISIDTKQLSPRPRSSMGTPSPRSRPGSSTAPKTPSSPLTPRSPLSAEDLRLRMIERSQRSPGPKYNVTPPSPTRNYAFPKDDRMKHFHKPGCSPGPSKYSAHSPLKASPGGSVSRSPRVTDFWTFQ
ncbi:hypothetical protein GEMRC1_009071 [Eukaryota sp. GEM-RC1]